jgi:hypothetical protein
MSGSEYISWLNQPISDDEEGEFELSPNTIQQYTYSPNNTTSREPLETIITTTKYNKSIIVTGKPIYGCSNSNTMKKKKKSSLIQKSSEALLSYDEYMNTMASIEHPDEFLEKEPVVVSEVQTIETIAIIEEQVNPFELEHTHYLLRSGIMGIVLSFCTMQQLMEMMTVNKQFFKMCSSNYFWKSMYFNRWKRLYSMYNNRSKNKKKDYRDKYIRDYRDHKIWRHTKEIAIESSDEYYVITMKQSVLLEETDPPQDSNLHIIEECLHCRSKNIIHVKSNDVFSKQCEDCFTITELMLYGFNLFD